MVKPLKLEFATEGLQTLPIVVLRDSLVIIPRVLEDNLEAKRKGIAGTKLDADIPVAQTARIM